MKHFVFIALILLTPNTALLAQNSINLEDYNDQDYFTNISGNWGELIASYVDVTFDTAYFHGDYGSAMRIEYGLPPDSFGGTWISLFGPADNNNYYLDFTDLYGGLSNSTGNPIDIENVSVTHFRFWAKGNGVETLDHEVKIEFKDVNNIASYKIFTVPNQSDWTQYEFPITDMESIDITRMKMISIILEAWRNDNRHSNLYFDDLSLATDEVSYDVTTWSDDQFLDLVAHRAFNYFLIYTDDLDFAFDRSTFTDLVSVGSIGFQLAAYCIGDQRGWSNNLESRVETILANLTSLPMGPEPGTVNAGYRGFFYHFLDANTGLRKNSDVELSLYDTMLLMYGALACKEYFSENANIQTAAQDLYDAVEWDWMVDTAPGEHQYQFHLAWKPETEFEEYVDGYTDEALLVDVLGIGSDTHPTTMDTYNARNRSDTINIWNPQYQDSTIIASWTGSLFTYSFASCWLDIIARGEDKHDMYPLNIWENNRRAIEANRQYCIDHQYTFSTYCDSSWGLTACNNLPPDSSDLTEYFAFGALPTEGNIRSNGVIHAPSLGTIAIYGAGSAIAYTQEASISALRYYYSVPGLWNPLFGLGDAFSTDPHYFEANSGGEPILDPDDNLIIHPALRLNGPWINNMVMGINQGPMLLTIENCRNGAIWNLTNMNANIDAGLDSIFVKDLTSVVKPLGAVPLSPLLDPNYPNPFNPFTTIEYSVRIPGNVQLVIYDVAGRWVRTLIEKEMAIGRYKIIWNGKNDRDKNVSSGVYFYHLKNNGIGQTRKAILIR